VAKVLGAIFGYVVDYVGERIIVGGVTRVSGSGFFRAKALSRKEVLGNLAK
jgi:hypothetical protein